jgi:hypothetical protein
MKDQIGDGFKDCENGEDEHKSEGPPNRRRRRSVHNSAEEKEASIPAEKTEEEKMEVFHQIDDKKYYVGKFGPLGEIKISLHTMVSLSLLQLPAVVLALYGIICALISSDKKFIDCLLALPLILIPFGVTEIFAVININCGLGCIGKILEIPLKLCGKCWDKTVSVEKVNLLKFLPQMDKTGKTDQDLGLQLIKLIFGSCLQLCYQSVLLAAYTPKAKFGFHQVLSIVSSTLMISRSVALIIKYEIPQKQVQDMDWSKKLAAALVAFRHLLYHRLPLVLTSLIFQTGTLVMAIVVAEWYAMIYIVLVLLLNLIISLSVPIEALEIIETKLKVTYKFNKEQAEEISSKPTTKASFHPFIHTVFVSWANLFVAIRLVEHMSYSKIAPMLLLQPPRFILNILTLVILLFFTYTPSSAINSNVVRHEYPLIVTYAVLFTAGIINQILFVSAFYTRIKTTSEAGNVNKEIELNKVEVEAGLQDPTGPNSSTSDPTLTTSDDKQLEEEMDPADPNPASPTLAPKPAPFDTPIKVEPKTATTSAILALAKPAQLDTIIEVEVEVEANPANHLAHAPKPAPKDTPIEVEPNTTTTSPTLALAKPAPLDTPLEVEVEATTATTNLRKKLSFKKSFSFLRKKAAREKKEGDEKEGEAKEGEAEATPEKDEPVAAAAETTEEVKEEKKDEEKEEAKAEEKEAEKPVESAAAPTEAPPGKEAPPPLSELL